MTSNRWQWCNRNIYGETQEHYGFLPGITPVKTRFFICTLPILYLFQCHKRLRWERSSKYLLSLSKLSYIFILVRFLLTYVTTLEVLFLMNSVPLLVNLYDWEVSKTFKTGSSVRYAELGNCSFTAEDDFPKSGHQWEQKSSAKRRFPRPSFSLDLFILTSFSISGV